MYRIPFIFSVGGGQTASKDWCGKGMDGSCYTRDCPKAVSNGRAARKKCVPWHHSSSDGCYWTNVVLVSAQDLALIADKCYNHGLKQCMFWMGNRAVFQSALSLRSFAYKCMPAFDILLARKVWHIFWLFAMGKYTGILLFSPFFTQFRAAFTQIRLCSYLGGLIGSYNNFYTYFKGEFCRKMRYFLSDNLISIIFF